MTGVEKRDWFRGIYDDAQSNGVCLEEYLRQLSKQFRESATAGDIASISANGQSTTFSNSGLKVAEIRLLIAQFREYFDEAKQALLDDETIASDTTSETYDPLVKVEMLKLIVSSKVTYPDFSELRCGPVLA